MHAYSTAEVADLRTRPTQGLTPDELWAAHKSWAFTCILRVLRLAPPHIRLPDLISDAYMALAQAASTWSPTGGASFTTYSGWIIRKRLLDAVHELRHDSRPRPKRRETPDRGHTIELDAVRRTAEMPGTEAVWARAMLRDIVEADQEFRLGDVDLQRMDPQQILEMREKLSVFRQRLEAWQNHHDKRKRMIATRMIAAMFDGKTLQEIADEQGVSRAAVGHSLCTARLYLQDMLGLPVELKPGKAARRRKVRQRWGRNKTRAENRKRNVCSPQPSRKKKSPASEANTPSR